MTDLAKKYWVRVIRKSEGYRPGAYYRSRREELTTWAMMAPVAVFTVYTLPRNIVVFCVGIVLALAVFSAWFVWGRDRWPLPSDTANHETTAA